MRSWVLFAFAAAALISAGCARPESRAKKTQARVTLDGGPTLEGSLLSAADGKLKLETGFAGTIEIGMQVIASIVTEGDVRVTTRSGAVHLGALSEERGQAGPVSGRVKVGNASLALDEIDTINKNPRAWTGFVELGGSLARGNSRTAQLSLGAGAEFERKNDKLVFQFLAHLAESEITDSSGAKVSATVQQDLFLAATYRHAITKDLYGYGRLDLLHDEFKQLDLRVVTAAGLGYKLLEERKHKLSIEAGAALRYEDLAAAPDEESASAHLAAAYRWLPRKGLIIENSVDAFPGAGAAGTILRGVISVNLALKEKLHLRVGYVLEFDSRPGLDSTGAQLRKADQRLMTTLIFRF